MPDSIDRERFERDYRAWILLMAKDVTHRLAAMPSERRAVVLKSYNKFKNPLEVFHKFSDPARIARLAGDRSSGYIIIETKAITFFPSLYSSAHGVLDFAVAMNRQFFCRNLWFPIISLNSDYIQQSSDRVLAFALDHEFEMSRIYQDISLNLRALSSEEKRKIAESAQEISTERLKITQEELIEDETLMVQLSNSQPLIPKPYAERAMFLYLKDNFEELKTYGLPSRSTDEASFGEELYEEFESWAEFSKSTYNLFVREILSNLIDADRGYG